MYMFRKAEPSDYDFIFSLNKTVYEDYIIKVWGNWDDEFQKQFCNNRLKAGNIQILLYNGKEIGVLELIEKDHRIHIEEIQIHPNNQGKGIGTEIINDIIKRAFQSNCSVGLMVLKINQRAKRLYEKLGFNQVGETDTHCIMETVECRN